MVKKFNKVIYPDNLFHDGEKYELFGTVVHSGAPNETGHYFNYVKCENYDILIHNDTKTS